MNFSISWSKIVWSSKTQYLSTYLNYYLVVLFFSLHFFQFKFFPSLPEKTILFGHFYLKLRKLSVWRWQKLFAGTRRKKSRYLVFQNRRKCSIKKTSWWHFLTVLFVIYLLFLNNIQEGIKLNYWTRSHCPSLFL